MIDEVLEGCFVLFSDFIQGSHKAGNTGSNKFTNKNSTMVYTARRIRSPVPLSDDLFYES